MPHSQASSQPANHRHGQPRGFDFTGAMRRVCQRVVADTPELAHIDVSRVAVSFARARSPSKLGLYAYLTPLRFAGGAETTLRRGIPHTIQRFTSREGVECLYILSFCMPRFQNLDLREKLITVFHELWHISPRFDGDIRRHEGRCYAHTGSQQAYDEAMGVLADRWLAAGPPEEIWGFLRHSFAELHEMHGGLHGVRLPRAKLSPVPPARVE